MLAAAAGAVGGMCIAMAAGYFIHGDRHLRIYAAGVVTPGGGSALGFGFGIAHPLAAGGLFIPIADLAYATYLGIVTPVADSSTLPSTCSCCLLGGQSPPAHLHIHGHGRRTDIRCVRSLGGQGKRRGQPSLRQGRWVASAALSVGWWSPLPPSARRHYWLESDSAEAGAGFYPPSKPEGTP